jgi:hypothetical protein
MRLQNTEARGLCRPKADIAAASKVEREFFGADVRPFRDPLVSTPKVPTQLPSYPAPMAPLPPHRSQQFRIGRDRVLPFCWLRQQLGGGIDADPVGRECRPQRGGALRLDA